LDVNLSDDGNTFNIHSTHAAITNLHAGAGNDLVNIETTAGPTNVVMGAGTNVVRVGSTTATDTDPAQHSTLDSISGGLLYIDGAAGHTSLFAYDSGETIANTSALTSRTLTGLGMTLGIQYTPLDLIDIRLSNGPNTFFVNSTRPRTTLHVYGGDQPVVVNQYSDLITVKSIGGPATIEGGNGSDLLRVNYDAAGNQTFK